jgi:A/G-specific adenine glycosylase
VRRRRRARGRPRGGPGASRAAFRAAPARVVPPPRARPAVAPHARPVPAPGLELMLQQTQVARVVDYYAASSSASRRSATWRGAVERGHRRWAGLGYYARARNLHALARHVTRDGGPGRSRRAGGAARAAGVGRTPPAPWRASPTSGARARRHERRARAAPRVRRPTSTRARGPARACCGTSPEAILPRTGRAAWTHNQALMELGALVCTARARHCAGLPGAPRVRHARAARLPRDADAPPRPRRRLARRRRRAAGAAPPARLRYSDSGRSTPRKRAVDVTTAAR